jgi:hypothetical protein
MDVSAAPVLIEAIQREDLATTGAMEALPRLGKSAVPALLKVLDSTDARSVQRAYTVLWKMHPEDLPAAERKQVLNTLLERAKKGETQTFPILGPFGDDSAEAVPYILAALENRDTGSAQKMAYARALSRIGKTSVPGLIRVVSSGDMWARYYAADALGRIGAPAAQAVPVLLETRMDLDPQVRNSARDAIVRIGPGAIPHLVEALKSDDAFLRGEAVGFLEYFRGHARPAIPLLRKLADNDDDPMVRQEAQLLLNRLKKLD